MEKTSVELKRIGVFSLAKFVAVLYGVLGLIIGAMFSCFSLIGAAAAADLTDSGIVGALFGLGAIIIMPIFYGIMGLIFGTITALIYNMVAGAIGGLQLEFN